MPFRYINPGYAELFRNKSMTSGQSNTFNPINDVYMKNGEAYCSLPDGCSEVWVKFGFYYNGYNYQMGCYFGDTRGTYGFYRYKCEENKAYLNGVSTLLTNIADYAYHTVWMHCRAGQEGILEIFLDGREEFTQTGAIVWKEQYVYFKSGSDRVYLSNIIISDREISKTDEVYILEPAGTETDMTESDGLYVADSEGQYVRQTIDVAAFKAKAGSSAVSVTGLAVASVPAYYEGEGLTSLVAVRNESEIESVALSTAEAKKGAISSWDESMAVDDLAGITLGWKAAN